MISDSAMKLKTLTLSLALPILVLFGLKTSAQMSNSKDFGAKLGAALYLGDVGSSGSLGIDLNQMRYHVGGSFRNFFSPHIAIQASLTYGQIRGSDKNSKSDENYSRNLSFKNDIIELSARGEWHFLVIRDVGRSYTYRSDFNMYAFAGIGAFYNNPKGLLNGNWVALQPLQTEGVSYSKIQPVVPLGIGFHFKFNKHHLIGWEFGLRKTFTDYIDDVSTRYVHYTEFTDPTALALQDRSVELEGSGDPKFIGSQNYSYGTDPAGTAPRGNAEKQDWYAFTGITYSYAIKGKKRSFTKRKYHFSRRKFKRKRSRAKF